jgi:hypothetical protein
MMQKVLQELFSFLPKANAPQKKKARKSTGQSLVEVAIAFPVLIILFSGVVEFGFILNYYLSLLDATRESARFWSGDDPFCNEVTPSCTAANVAAGDVDDPDFYLQAATTVRKLLDPSLTYADPTDYKGRRIILDPAIDDVIVSVYGASGSNAILWRDGGAYHLFPTDGHLTGNYPSIFDESTIENTRVSGAPDAGLLVVEVHYNYHHVLGLPWMQAFLSDPLHLRAYTIMPIRSGEPAP